MVSTFTTARGLEKPAAGDQLGTWGTASVNPNMDVIDAGMGQSATISAAAGSVVLAANQFRCAQITFNSTLLFSMTVTFPTSFTGPYTIYHAATGSSAFTITLATTAAGGEAICCPPGELIDIWNDGTNIRFRNLERVGTVIQTQYSSMPNWIDGCTKKPYLNCDGTTFSSGTYPFLYATLGSTTLPDYRGRYIATLNQGTGRITSSLSGGVDGDTRGSAGGTTMITSAYLPATAMSSAHTHGYTDRYWVEAYSVLPSTFFGATVFKEQIPGGTSYNAGFGANSHDSDNDGWLYYNSTTSVSSNLTFGTTTPTGYVPPTAVAGITMIRAA